MGPPYLNTLAVSVEKEASRSIAKASFPLRYGRYSEIKSADFEFVFNLNGEIKFVRGLNTNWPHPAEQFKRTDGNDWVYYSLGDESGDKGIVSWTGEYYLPCLPYPSNPVWELDYFSDPIKMGAFSAWSQLYADLYMGSKDRFGVRARKLINAILANDDTVLYQRAQTLRAIIGGRISVLPPDTRHVDYEVIPLNVADGCLYHCKFCCVKSSQRFQVRTTDNIIEQVRRLKLFYGRNLENYNALFLGGHDALAAGEAVISLAAKKAYEDFNFGIRAKRPSLFLFGSVDALLHSKNRLFEQINQLPYYTYINVGLESISDSVLRTLGKPLGKSHVLEAFEKMLDLNASFENIETTGNFVLGEGLPETHAHSLADLLRNAPVASCGKGGIYLSPLKDNPKKRELLPSIREIKKYSKLPVFVYLIQRL